MRRNLVMFLFVFPSLLYAGGFQLNVQGLKAIGMGGASTGVTPNVSSVFFNPAALTKIDGHHIAFGINFIDPSISLQTAQTANIDQTSATGTPFHLYYSGEILKAKLDNKLRVGFLINNQFGSSASFDDDWQGRFIIQNIELKTFMFQPTLAYQLHDKLSVGGGIVFTTGSFNLERALPVGGVNTTEGGASLKGDGTGVGFNIGLYSKFFNTKDIDEQPVGIGCGSRLPF